MDPRITVRPDATYLGDSVYLQPSDHEANAWWLFTYNGIKVQDQIYLEWEVASRLRQRLENKQ